jgi:drug/metabolite transporter (DMT)-like permease
MAGISYLGSLALLRVGGPVYLSQIGYVVTAVSVAIGALLFGERYGIRDWITIGLIFVGVMLSSGATKSVRVKAWVDSHGCW